MKIKIDWRWTFTVIIITFVLSTVLAFASQRNVGLIAASLVLFVLIFLGIAFDMISIAVASADLAPFHSMSARRVRGSREAVILLKHRAKVVCVSSDIIGDVLNIISGAMGAFVIAAIVEISSIGNMHLLNVIMSASIAALTVGGKAMGKNIAINSSTRIVLTVGWLLSFIFHLKPGRRSKKEKKK